MRKIVLIGTVLTLLALASVVSAEPLATHTVSIGSGGFSPAKIIVPMGDAVRWTSNGRHRVVADDGYFDSGVLGHGDDYVYTFNQYPAEGREYTYYDALNPSHTGTVCINWCNDKRWYSYLPLVMSTVTTTTTTTTEIGTFPVTLKETR